MKNTRYTLITGATSGIGRACADLLAEEGKNLILVGRRNGRLEALKKDYEKRFKIDVRVFLVDVTDGKQVSAFFRAIKNLSLDALINNAGLALGTDKLQEADWGDIETMIQTNIIGCTRFAKDAIPFLQKTKGHIVNLGSIAGNEAYEGGTVYCATKAYVKMMSAGLRIDVAGTGIRVTAIAPGAVNTEFATVRFHGDKKKADQIYEGFTPLVARDVAECVRFALSRPPHVNIDFMLVMPTAQASVKRFAKI